MRYWKLRVLSSLSLLLIGCSPCFDDACSRNEFEVDVAPSPAGGGPGNDRIVSITATGPCTLDLQRTGCDLSVGCTAVAIAGAGIGTCHVAGKSTFTGDFSIDVPYESCASGCGITVYVTNHFNLILGGSSDAGAF